MDKSIKPYDPVELVDRALEYASNAASHDDSPLNGIEMLPKDIFDAIETQFRELAVRRIEETSDDILPDSLDPWYDFDPDEEEAELIRRMVVEVWMWVLKSAFTNSRLTRDLMLEWITKNMLEE